MRDGGRNVQANRGIAVWTRRCAVAGALWAAWLGPSLRAQGPPSSVPVQGPIETDGVLEVQYEDWPAGTRIVHFLHVGSQRVRVQLDADAPQLLTGSRLHVRGTMRNGTLDLSRSGGGSVQTLSVAGTNTFGQQQTLVLLINFQDNTSTSTDVPTASSTTFQTVSNYYLETTYGQTWLAGEVDGWFTLPMNSTTCDTATMASLADQAATAAGINVGAFARKVYAFPQIAACGWWGLGTVGGNPSEAWINGAYALKVVAHELGHGFGMYHSHSQPCDSTGCSVVEYGDDHDMMGQTSTGHFNAFQKERMGWLNYGGSPPIQTVTTSGTYWIDAMEPVGTAPKAIKISKGNGTFYYVEVRSSTGFDGGDAPGVLVHSGSSTDGNSSLEIDLDPVTSAFDAILDAGQTFVDGTIGLSITPSSVTSAGAWLNVSYSGPPCVAAAPTVSLSPATTVVAAAGQSVSYTLALKNNDSSSCAATMFGLSAIVPANWSASLSPTSVSVAPGGSASATLMMAAPAGTSGTFTFTAATSRQNTAGADGSASGSIFVASSLSVSLSIAAAGNGEQLTASVSAGSTPVPSATVRFAVTNPLGTVTTLSGTTNASGMVTVKMQLKGKLPHGTYQVGVTATGMGLIGTATGSFVY